MPLIKNRYGKGRVRVMRIHRDGDRHEVSQLSVKAMIEGDFARAYTHADNSTSVATDTIKNIVNVVARDPDGRLRHDTAQRDHRDLTSPAADVHYHGPLRLVHRQPGTYSRG